MAVVETRHGKVEGDETDRLLVDVPANVSSSVLVAERQLWEGQPDGTTVGKL